MQTDKAAPMTVFDSNNKNLVIKRMNEINELYKMRSIKTKLTKSLKSITLEINDKKQIKYSVTL